MIEYKTNLFAYAALLRHLSGCFIIVILANFVLQTHKIQT